MWSVYYRTVDGVTHWDKDFDSWEEAWTYLERVAEECRKANHRIVDLDEGEERLRLSYSGDDMVVMWIAEEEEWA